MTLQLTIMMFFLLKGSFCEFTPTFRGARVVLFTNRRMEDCSTRLSAVENQLMNLEGGSNNMLGGIASLRSVVDTVMLLNQAVVARNINKAGDITIGLRTNSDNVIENTNELKNRLYNYNRNGNLNRNILANHITDIIHVTDDEFLAAFLREEVLDDDSQPNNSSTKTLLDQKENKTGFDSKKIVELMKTLDQIDANLTMISEN